MIHWIMRDYFENNEELTPEESDIYFYNRIITNNNYI